MNCLWVLGLSFWEANVVCLTRFGLLLWFVLCQVFSFLSEILKESVILQKSFMGQV